MTKHERRTYTHARSNVPVHTCLHQGTLADTIRADRRKQRTQARPHSVLGEQSRVAVWGGEGCASIHMCAFVLRVCAWVMLSAVQNTDGGRRRGERDQKKKKKTKERLRNTKRCDIT